MTGITSTPYFGSTAAATPGAEIMSHAVYLQPQALAPSPLDTLAQGSQYVQQLQQQQRSVHGGPASSPTISSPKHRSHPYGNGAVSSPGAGRRGSTAESIGGNNAVRRRISRACDQCNQLRTKCDGKNPCAHCVEFGLGCEYVRERKKRGKASRKDLVQREAAAAAAAAGAGPTGLNAVGSTNGLSNGDEASATSGQSHTRINGQTVNPADLPPPPVPSSRTLSMGGGMLGSNGLLNDVGAIGRTGSLGNLHEISSSAPINHHHHPQLSNQHEHLVGDQTGSQQRQANGEGPVGLGLGALGPVNEFDPSGNVSAPGGPGALPPHVLQNGQGNPPMIGTINPTSQMNGYGDRPFPVPNPPTRLNQIPGMSFGTGESPLTAWLGASPNAGSPGWLSLPSPSASVYDQQQQQQQYNNPAQPLRYPVLRPLLPYISQILPVSLACDLLDLYFASSSSAYIRPLSPYLLGYVFRKRSFLNTTNPRPCSLALLASMLWVGAQTSEAAFLTSPPSARGRVCQRLLELTVGLLRPLIHGPSNGEAFPNPVGTVINGVALGGLGVANQTSGDQLNGPEGAVGASGALDDVATYMHLATVVSASEYKAASLRWWNCAWTLARELKLNRELPPNPPNSSEHGHTRDGHDDLDADGDTEVDMGIPRNNQQTSNRYDPVNAPGVVTEEEREERRRIWWLLYTVDRHLALCYNRPLFLLDMECDGLLQPMDDKDWQAGNFSPYTSLLPSGEPSRYRRRGPTFECTGHSIFGYFLPLMTILGEIVDLHHARNHPRFGLGFRGANEWDDQAAEISRQLEAYGSSLREFEARQALKLQESTENNHAGENPDAASPSVRSAGSAGSRMTESIMQTKIVVAYGTHVMHVLHILLTGKWDPISLLDDNDLWISSQSFISATGHAVSAAEAIDDILDYDPDLSFMPFFFGIYLLQGSFLLLLIADKLQGEASPSVVKACETIVRAHEVCVVTLNTEYQRNFRKVMRSALAQVRGRIPEDFGEQQLRRREVLALYRWTGDGTGLAL